MMNYRTHVGVLFAVALSLSAVFIPLTQISETQAQPASGDDMPIDKAKRTAIVDSVCFSLNKTYIFADVAEKMEKYVRKNLKKGDYDNTATIAEFADALAQDLREVSHDLHLDVRYASPERLARMSEERDPAEREREHMEEMERQNFLFKKVEILPGNVGYVRFDQFVDARFAGATAIAAMNYLAYTDAIIFDLRQNGGGSPSLIQLITSYFFDDTVHLNSFYIRENDSTEQFWTSAHVEGPRMSETKLYVLTSDHTFSGAEEFSYNLKHLERATVVGDTTGGGAHPVNFVQYPSLNTELKLPFGKAVNPITGTNWEGVGVVPNVVAPVDLALDTAHLMALREIREESTDDGEKFALDWAIFGLEAKTNPVSVEATTLATYAGSYGPRTLILENGYLYYQREGRPRFRLDPLTDRIFTIEGLDFFRLEVVVDESGQPVSLVGLYDNGNRDETPRTPAN